MEEIKGMETLSREATPSNLFCLLSEKGSTFKRGKMPSSSLLKRDLLLPSEKGSFLKGKNLLPRGVNSFLLEKIPFRADPFLLDPFQKGLGIQESKQGKKIVSSDKWWTIYLSI